MKSKRSWLSALIIVLGGMGCARTITVRCECPAQETKAAPIFTQTPGWEGFRISTDAPHVIFGDNLMLSDTVYHVIYP